MKTKKFWVQHNAVVIATRYGVDGPGLESRWGGNVLPLLHFRQDRLWDPPNLLYQGYRRSFPGGEATGAWRWWSLTLF